MSQEFIQLMTTDRGSPAVVLGRWYILPYLEVIFLTRVAVPTNIYIQYVMSEHMQWDTVYNHIGVKQFPESNVFFITLPAVLVPSQPLSAVTAALRV